MNKSKVLVVFILICYVLFAIFQFSGSDSLAYYFYSVIVPLITVLYLFTVKRKSKLFLFFLIFHASSDIIGMTTVTLPYDESGILYDFDYYAANTSCILAYIFLIIKISISLNFRHIFKYFKMYLVVLIILNIYLLYVIQAIISPNLVFEIDYYLELIYNIVVLLLLAIALLNYLYKDNKKALYFFLGALGIIFSEVMDIAYIYIDQSVFIYFLSITLEFMAFYFLFQQSRFLNFANGEKKYAIY